MSDFVSQKVVFNSPDRAANAAAAVALRDWLELNFAPSTWSLYDAVETCAAQAA